MISNSKIYFWYEHCREALSIADEILIGKRDRDNPKALSVKAEAMYNLGSFEHALMCFHNALRRSNVKVQILSVFLSTLECE